MHPLGTRVGMILVIWSAAALGVGLAATSAGAAAPDCQSGTLPAATPSCTCFDTSTSAERPTPGNCPDMLEGQRVIFRGDYLSVSNTLVESNDDRSVLKTLIVPTVAGTSNPGLGEFDVPNEQLWQRTTDCQSPGPGIPVPFQARPARLFDLDHDVLVSLAATENTVAGCTTGGPFDDSNLTWWISEWPLERQQGTETLWAGSYDGFQNPDWLQLAVADFDHDGYDDVWTQLRGRAQVYSAKDVTDPSAGLEPFDPLGLGTQAVNEPTTGDFNGDGIVDVVWIGGNVENPAPNESLKVFFASVCPGDVPNTICDHARRFQIITNPAGALFPGVPGATSNIDLNTSAAERGVDIALQGSYLSPNNCNKDRNGVGGRPAAAVVLTHAEDLGNNAAGSPVDGLVIALVRGTGGAASSACKVNAEYWTFQEPTASDPRWARFEDEVVDILSGANVTGSADWFGLHAQTTKLDWYGDLEQPVVFSATSDPNTRTTFSFPSVLSVARDGERSTLINCIPDKDEWVNLFRPGTPVALFGAAAGVFTPDLVDNEVTLEDGSTGSACANPAFAKPGDCSANPSIAALYPSLIGVYHFERGPGGQYCQGIPAGSFRPVDVNFFQYFDFPVTSRTPDRAGSLLQAGDFTGLSTRVGEPEVARIEEHHTIQMVVQAPPMHIDFVAPEAGGASEPELLNLSVAPLTYNTTYESESEQEQQAGQEQTTSYSTAVSGGFEIEAKKSVPLVEGIDVKNKESWQKENENETKQSLSVYSSSIFETRKTTGFSDEVWYTSTSMNIFHYPILGRTACPAEIVCDATNPANLDCVSGDPEQEITLSCAEDTSGTGCNCANQEANLGLCPTLPSEPGVFNCSGLAPDVCCATLEQQAYLSMSGPEQIDLGHLAGSALEYYQPLHMEGQLFSYPASREVLAARFNSVHGADLFQPWSDGQTGSFATLPGALDQTTRWRQGEESESSVGTTTRHSFDSETSVTLGTPEIEKRENGVSVTGFFDYSQSSSAETLNSATFGQSTSTGIRVSVEEADFLDDPVSYAYTVTPWIYGSAKPASVLDDPPTTVCPADNVDCSDAEKQFADISTTGPLIAGYTAIPNLAPWWANGPYAESFDVALNHPERWRKVDKDDALDPAKQCRGRQTELECYDIRPQSDPEASASQIWDNGFYRMRGLFVTVGGTAGPTRNQAAVGDVVYLQARVYNFSNRDTVDEDGNPLTVLAGFYRQPVAVNTVSGQEAVVEFLGNPLPVGSPVPVVNPKDGSATINRFNDGSQCGGAAPCTAFDNVSLATTSFRTTTDDAVKKYWLFWVVVWAERDDGSVAEELEGHGLAASFDPGIIYNNPAAVPLEQVERSDGSTSSFSNNVGLFPMVFAVVDEETLRSTVENRRGLELGIDRLVARPLEGSDREWVVSGQVVSRNAATSAVTAYFSSGTRDGRGSRFDVEHLAHIGADGTHFFRVPYEPTSCGPQEIFVEAKAGTHARAEAHMTFAVPPSLEIEALDNQVDAAGLPQGLRRSLKAKLDAAERSFERGLAVHGRTNAGLHQLSAFAGQVATQAGGKIPGELADAWLDEVDQIVDCVLANGPLSSR